MAVALALGGLTYQRQQVQELGQDVYYELEGDSLPPLPGVLDDPVFAELPPPSPDQPVSWGRYKPAEQRSPVASSQASAPAADAQPKPRAPTSASGSTAQTNAGPQTNSGHSAAPQTAPTRFSERLTTQTRLHILLIGNDQPQLGRGRGDVLVVLTFDPVAQKLTFLSIPRDTRVQIPERDGMAKINAAYALGGPTLQTLAVERFLGIPMDKFVEVSMDGFQRVIDLVGGVEVSPPFAFELDGQQFRPGRVTLNGEQALAYTRMRKDDPKGDLGRNERQQEVIRSLMQSLGKRSPEELSALLQQLRSQVRTNFSPSEVVALRRTHNYALEQQSVLRPAGKNVRIDGQWFYVVADQERQRLHLALR
ncbi:hypothetical protein GCM10017783_12110 [Deinococcus piscis]|uniref:Cell envelope-related transcriptional attenuator domain-containing protein n=1 Tax=Deinococcus piscis TaxID=394230 RepID=A0ABQ3K5A2_9DEIO|nr:hypothetical protein GCM10017783_12110 [Deinococcus piscis]